MKLLLDTHVLLWAVNEPDKLSKAARETLEIEDNVIYFSPISISEIAIKAARYKDFEFDVEACRKAALQTFVELPYSSEHAVALKNIPILPFDPFDRMLLAQAASEPLHLLTADRKLIEYEHGIFPV